MHNKEQITPQWLAGFFDGEGSVFVTTTRNKYNCMTIYARLAQSDFPLLWVIMNMFPDGCDIYAQKSGNIQIAWSNKDVIPFLEYIKNYVVQKRDIVEYALEIAYTYGNKGVHLKRDVVEKREKLGSLISNFNNRERIPSVQ